MIKRTQINYIKDKIKTINKEEIVYLGCYMGAWDEAGTVVDLKDLSEYYKDKRFVKSDVCNTPFRDREFKFSVASHIAEHISNPEDFIKEITRISDEGYIEVSSPLFNNLVFGNQQDHLWWVTYDDITDELVFREQQSILNECIDIKL
jgi:hypothetical protein